MQKTKDKKLILVTGGAGFIGSNLIEALMRDQHNKVVSLDNYFTGTKDNHIKGATYIDGHTKNIEKLVKNIPDIVYHLGEYSRVEQSFDDAALVWDLNIIGTLGVLEFCKKHNVKLVYAGSSTKFSDNGLGRYQSPYAWAKASNTDLVRNFGEWYGLSYAITYFYNVYGPRERSGCYGTVIEIFKKQYQKGKPIAVRAPGTQMRNFTHVEDIVRGLILVGEHGEGDEFGLGANKEYSITEVAEMFGGEIKMLSERKGNRQVSELNIKKSKALGWEAKKTLEEYIAIIKKEDI